MHKPENVSPIFYEYVSTIGQDSHAFVSPSQDHNSFSSEKPLILGGFIIPHHIGLQANSDGDVVLHAITNAISGLTGRNILGAIADEMCNVHHITDSSMYLKEALKDLKKWEIMHVSLSLECKTPRLSSYVDAIKSQISSLIHVEAKQIGFTATSGEELTAFGQGKGIGVLANISFRRPVGQED